MFGPHLMLEGYDCQNKAVLSNPEQISDILNTLPARMGMTIIMPPRVMHYDGGEIPEDEGVSGFVIIAESHLSIHTFPQKNFFVADIFSCKEFDTAEARDYLNSFFQPGKYEELVLERGREFPRSLPRAAAIVSDERSSYSCSFSNAK